LPIYWRGVDAQSSPNHEVKIDWELIKEALDESENNPLEAYTLLCKKAVLHRDSGDGLMCGYYASHGLVAANYGEKFLTTLEEE